MAQDPMIRALKPAGVPVPTGPYSPGVKAGDWIFVSGRLASDYTTGVTPEVAELNPYTNDILRAESDRLLGDIAAIIADGGGDISADIVRIYQWFTDSATTLEHWDQGDFFPTIKIGSYAAEMGQYVAPPRPASTGMAVTQQLAKDAHVQVDCMCRVDGADRTAFETPEGVPSPLMPYSPAMRRGEFVYLAGDIPTDWVGDFKRSDRRSGGDALADEASVNPYFWYETPIEKQVAYTLYKQSKIAEAAGTSLANAVKAEVYLALPSDFPGLDSVWREWFPENPPARTVIPYMGMAGKDARVEISFILLARDSKLEMETIYTASAPQPLGHEPQAVRCADLVFLSTQMPFDSGGSLAERLGRAPGLPYFGVPARDQMRYMRKNIAAIAEAARTSIDNTVRLLSVYDDLAKLSGRP